MKFLIAILLTCFAVSQALAVVCPDGDADFAPQYTNPALFLPALERTAQIAPWQGPVAAVTVPHHLEVPDLIAGGLRLAAGARPKRILVLFPDHFNRADRFFATTTRGFDTLLGPVPTDAKGARHLIAAGIPESCLFGADHGIGSILPFLAHLLPGVPVLPVALSIHTTPAQWDALAGHLKALVDDDTLIVQSTDFSHYLPHHEARLRDQQVLNILAARDMEALGRLDQPDHIDSLAAMYLTLRLTEGRAEPLVLANRNQQEVSSIPLQETTSYMVILFAKPAGPAPQRFMDETILVLGGDMFLGRQIPRILSDELAAQRVEDAVLAASGGSPMIVNLEGVLLDELPPNLPHLTLAMPLDMAIDWAGRLNIIAMGLANNHAKDLGPDALARTQAVLDAAGIASARHGERLDLPGLVLTALRDLSNTEPPYANMIDPDDLAHLVVEDATRQSVAFLHWGREGEAAPGPRERALADKARRRGVSLVIGAHSHIAAPRPETIGGGDTLVFWSLGNFLFDQRGPAASGILVELRVFAQGTVFARPLPLPNLFDLALGRIVP